MSDLRGQLVEALAGDRWVRMPTRWATHHPRLIDTWLATGSAPVAKRLRSRSQYTYQARCSGNRSEGLVSPAI